MYHVIHYTPFPKFLFLNFYLEIASNLQKLYTKKVPVNLIYPLPRFIYC